MENASGVWMVIVAAGMLIPALTAGVGAVAVWRLATHDGATPDEAHSRGVVLLVAVAVALGLASVPGAWAAADHAWLRPLLLAPLGLLTGFALRGLLADWAVVRDHARRRRRRA